MFEGYAISIKDYFDLVIRQLRKDIEESLVAGGRKQPIRPTEQTFYPGSTPDAEAPVDLEKNVTGNIVNQSVYYKSMWVSYFCNIETVLMVDSLRPCAPQVPHLHPY